MVCVACIAIPLAIAGGVGGFMSKKTMWIITGVSIFLTGLGIFIYFKYIKKCKSCGWKDKKKIKDKKDKKNKKDKKKKERKIKKEKKKLFKYK